MERLTRERVEAIYQGTSEINRFANEVMIPILTGQLNVSKKESVSINTYFRMCAWVHSMVLLNDIKDFQGIASAARSLFELYIDLTLLCKDKSGEAIEKYIVYPQVDKYRTSQELVEFWNKNKDKIRNDYSERQQYVTDNKNHIESLIKKHWGSMLGDRHWTGKSLKKRTEELGIDFELEYLENYSMLSWSIHPGGTCTARQSEDDFVANYGLFHGIAQRTFLEATILMASSMKITLAIDYFYDWIKELRQTPGKVLAAEKIKKLEETRKNVLKS